MKSPTMTDVARAAGVSHATVSRLINGRPGVSAKAEVAVRKAIADLQYLAPPSENRPGRSPRSNPAARNQHVALLTFDRALIEHSSFVASIYEGARKAANAQGFTLSLLSLDDCDTVPSWISGKNLDGLLLHGLRSRDRLTRTAAEIPSLWLTTNNEGSDDSVLPGNEIVGDIAAGYLNERKHRRTAVLNIDDTNPSYRVRAKSFLSAARKRGMETKSFHIPARKRERYASPSEQMKYLASKLAEIPKRNRPTGLFLPSDFMTALAHAAFRGIGLEPGGDFDFVSCDHEKAYLAGLFPCPATIDLGSEARGRLAFDLLHSRILDPLRERKATLVLDPVLILPE